MIRALLFSSLLLASSLMAGGEVAAEKRIALVIGNSAYRDSPLRNPVNDAADMAEVLRDSGFAVTLLIGIVTTLFCAVTVCKLAFDWYLERRGHKIQSLSI